jgi:transposase
MNNGELFDSKIPEGASQPSPARPFGPLRLRTAERDQIQWIARDLDGSLPEDHRARLLWDLASKLDLAKFYQPILARGRRAGAPATDPLILLTLWLLATSEGVGEASEVARLCKLHDAYRWVCGGVNVDPHTLSDFRIDHAEALDNLLTQVLGVLLKQGVLTLDRVAQDGMRTRASAGADSFRREPSLKECVEAARAHLEEVRREVATKGNRLSRKQQAARERGARERLERVERALEELPAARAPKRNKEDQANARVSTTDPEARVMKMGDGGFRPAYNLQLATDTQTRVIVGVAVTNVGGDAGELTPMLEQIEARTGKRPGEYLVDGGFVNREAFDVAAERGTTVFAPVPMPKDATVDRFAPKPDDGPGTSAWRKRMASDAAKETYKERAATAETTNADLCYPAA